MVIAMATSSSIRLNPRCGDDLFICLSYAEASLLSGQPFGDGRPKSCAHDAAKKAGKLSASGDQLVESISIGEILGEWLIEFVSCQGTWGFEYVVSLGFGDGRKPEGLRKVKLHRVEVIASPPIAFIH